MRYQILETKKVVLQKQLQALVAAKPILSTTANLVPTTAASSAAPMRAPTRNLEKPKNLNFSLFYEHEGEESHLIPFIRKYWSVNI